MTCYLGKEKDIDTYNYLEHDKFHHEGIQSAMGTQKEVPKLL